MVFKIFEVLIFIPLSKSCTIFTIVDSSIGVFDIGKEKNTSEYPISKSCIIFTLDELGMGVF